MEYTLRAATPWDSAAINRLCVDAYQEFADSVGPVHWQQMREFLSRVADLLTAGEPLVAENSGGLLGLVLYLPPGKSDGKSIPQDWASIRMLAVSPTCRGKGIGRRLTQECIDRARRDGAQAIGLTTSAMMIVAQPMYERMGFRKEVDLGERYGITETRYVLNFK